MDFHNNQPIFTLITGIAIFLTVAGYLSFLGWVSQSVSGIAILFFGCIIAVFLYPLIKKETKPAEKNRFFALAGALLFIFWLILLTGFFMSMTNNMPGYYEYTVSVRGLNNYQSGTITDIIVPLPMRDGKDVFSDDELQYKKFGDWTSLLVMTGSGKMLAFQTTERNLTNIEAKFFRQYPDGIEIRNVLNESLFPVLAMNEVSDSPQEKTSREFISKIYLNNATLPYDRSRPPVTFDLILTMNGGMIHSVRQGSYQVSILETVPHETRGWIPVSARITDLKGN